MKKTTFSILVNIKTADGFESIGRFYVGNTRKLAYSIFKELKGHDPLDQHSMLTIELWETVNNLPLNLQLKGCTLQQLAENCAFITKEVFKARNLEELI